jgi:preprotein translocase SecE subunit
MADDQPDQTKAKRLVKNPETFRERALKASEIGDQPTQASKVKRAGGQLVKPAAVPFKKAGQFKPLRPVGRAVRSISKIIFPAYFRNSWRELRRVTWPTWKQSRQLTVAVLIFALIFGALIAVVDYGLDKFFRNVLLK